MPTWLVAVRDRLFAIFDPARLTAAPELRFLGRTLFLAALVGVAAGLVGVGFVAVLDWTDRVMLQHIVVLELGSGAPGVAPLMVSGVPYLLMFVPALGALAAGALVHFAPEAAGGGVDATLRAYHDGHAHARRRVAGIKFLASVLTLGSGGSGGREGPTMQIGAAIGAGLARVLGLDERERRLLYIAGVAAGMAAVFRTPLGSALFAVEVLYRDGFESDALVPSVLASVFGYSVAVLVFGEHAIFTFPRGLGFHPYHLPLYLALGIVAAAVGDLLIDGLRTSRARFARLPVPLWLRPALGGLGFGLCASLATFVGGRLWFGEPRSLGLVGSGYGMVQAVFDHAPWLPVGLGGAALLLALSLLKVACTSLTVGSGGSAGDFAPALVVGALAGAAFGHVAAWLFPTAGVDPTAFALVGMAALFGGAAHVPLASLILACEMAGSYSLLVPSMLAIGVTSLLLRRRSLYDSPRREPPTRARLPTITGAIPAPRFDDAGRQ